MRQQSRSGSCPERHFGWGNGTARIAAPSFDYVLEQSVPVNDYHMQHLYPWV